ncbi:unnamed protein product [Symbiodinium pilosum]|uniref:Tyrosine-protein kinase ephrin type A/B receptor-like domain-containing protein n=1 Tax=Symbiodinium pilosum TaxID=2952 RepID=A0A812M9G8_SYMPI|nr:unnamed protein product [Symbiodinium pilosum]
MLSTVSGPLLLAFLLGWLVVVSTGEQCLPYAIPPAERRSLQSDTGTFPLGLWVNGNSHDVGVSAAFSILVEEIVGIHVFTDPRRPKNVKHAFYAIAGCEENATSGWVCEGKESRIHVMLSAYMLYNEDELAAVNRMRMGGIITVLGSVGYSLFEGLHVSQSLIAKAWETQGLALEYYRSYHYNQNPSAAFNKISEVNTSDLVPCAEWGIYSPHVLDMYLKLTGDLDGLDVADGSFRPRCHQQNWWLSPTCRSNTTECIPCITCVTWGYIWYVEEIMQKAAVFSIPMALAGGSGCGPGGSFEKLPLTYDMLFYSWGPDITFQSLQPVKIIFPVSNQMEHEQNIFTSARAEIDQEILAHLDLQQWAPEVLGLLKNLNWQADDVSDMLGHHASSMEPSDIWQAACTWLQTNEATWKSWIPSRNSCYAGQGMYSEATQAFVQERQAETICQPCPPGTYSALVSDKIGDTAECRQCEPGFRQASYAAVTCDPCLAGTFASQKGSTSLSFYRFRHKNVFMRFQSLSTVAHRM